MLEVNLNELGSVTLHLRSHHAYDKRILDIYFKLPRIRFKCWRRQESNLNNGAWSGIWWTDRLQQVTLSPFLNRVTRKMFKIDCAFLVQWSKASNSNLLFRVRFPLSPDYHPSHPPSADSYVSNLHITIGSSHQLLLLGGELVARKLYLRPLRSLT